MSLRPLSSAVALALLLAACGQAGLSPSAAPAPEPRARAAGAQPGTIAAGPSTRPGNFNALARAKPAPGAAVTRAAVPRGTPLAPVHLNERLGVPSFMWAQPGAAAGAVASARAGGPGLPRTPVEAARAHLAGAAAAYGLTAADTASASVTKVHDTGRGPVIVSFRQAPGGVEVFGEEVSVAMARDLSLVAISGALSPAAPSASAARGGARGGWTLDAPSAVAAALSDVSGEAFAAGDFAAVGQRGKDLAYDLAPAVAAARAERFLQAARARRVWFRLPAGLQPAWRVELAFEKLGAGQPLTYGSVVSAADGALLFRKDQREDDVFAYRVWASDVPPFLPDDGPQGLAGTPHPTGNLDGYQAPFVARKLVTLQSLPFSRNDPWLAAGAAQTSGNNVVAYADLVAPTGFNAGDVMGAASSPGAFDWAYDLAAAPAATPDQLQAAITQLFYVDNALHDWFYDVGFDEAAGNAQASNYGRGGVEGDPLLAEAQDAASTDNANMSTPSDGGSPRMQMYVWHNSDLVRAVVNLPAAIAGNRPARYATFGPQAFALTGDLAPAVPANACLNGTSTTTGSVTNDLTGKIALVDRGTCPFAAKVKAAQAAGAIGVLVRNVLPTQVFLGMSGTDATITIPSLLVGLADGAAIGDAITGGATVDVTLQRAPGLMRDGTIDDLIVAHEWGHYLTNRLVQDAAGLDTTQARAMGEGWGDFLSLLLAVREEDALVAANAGWSGVYATAGFVASGLDGAGNPNQGFYWGIRRMPYSTDFTKNNETFKNVQDSSAVPVGVPYAFWPAPYTTAASGGNSEVHNAGEVWASALWECYAALLRDTQGAAPRLTFGEANRRMREYLVASLKLLPQSPTFLEARDALLAAARAGDVADYLAFWKAFARRGFGVGAVGPYDRYSTTNEGVAETYAVSAVSVEAVTFGAVTSGCDDLDGTLDDGETGTLTLTLRNLGPVALPATATLGSSDGHVSFPGGAAVTVPPIPEGGTGTVSATVALSGAAPFEVADFLLTFPDPSRQLLQPAVGFQLRTDVDVLRAASATDTLEGDHFVWTPAADARYATGSLFERRTGSPVDHYLFGPDVGSTSDLTLTSPPLQVGPDSLTVAWDHFYMFESDASVSPGVFYDGGVVELSDDGGLTWHDVGGPLYGGTLVVSDAATGYVSTNPLAGRPAFVDANPSAYTTGTMDHVGLDLTHACTGGSACTGKTVQLRFRIGSDQGVAGPVGWLIDNVAFGGLVNTPFDLLVPDARRCVDRPPVASVGPDQVVDEGTPVSLDASASSDPDAGTVLSFSWVQTAGPAVALANVADARPTFTAPAVAADTALAFLVTVSDGQYSSSATTLVTVRHVNRPPVADAGPAQAVDERAVVTLDGTRSSDPDAGTRLAFAWTQTAGPPVTLLGAAAAQPTFVAPAVAADTVLTFQLVVNDGLVDGPPASVAVTVRHVNRAPVASVAATQPVDAGATVTLDASASSDPDGDPLTYAWAQLAGGPAVLFTGGATATPSFTAPQVPSDTVLSFRLTVSDGLASSQATVSVLVVHVNATPVASAGPAQRAPERTLVTLDGSASSDADPGTVLGYAWTQVGAPLVDLLGNGSAHPSFMAPPVSADTVLTFSLVVTDGKADSAPSTVQVTITHVNRPPVVDAGVPFSAPERSAVALTAAASDPDGDPLTYAWAQVSGPQVILGGADTSAPTFEAPEVTAATDLVFQVTASDGGLTATSQVTVTVENVNRPPVAQAGPPQAVVAGTVVHLDAGGSTDPDAGAVLTYAWTQTAGPAATLTGADTAAASFTAPAGTLTFQVAVSDGQAISTASVTVTASAAPGPGGCGCSATSANPSALLPFLFGLAFLRRRRVRPAAG